MAQTTGELEFAGKTALVTGAGRGIGRGIVKSLLGMGAKVYALDKVQETLDTLKAELPSVQIVCVDLVDWEATKETVGQIGFCDFLVNCAGLLLESTPFLDYKEEDLDLTYKVNFKAIVNVSQVVARKMIECGRPGVIVNISSVAALKPQVPGIVGYSSMKAALDMLTQVMALELGPHNIRAVALRPTAVRTQLMQDFAPELVDECKKKSPIGKVGEVEDIANAVAFVLSDKAALITGSGVNLDAGINVT